MAITAKVSFTPKHCANCSIQVMVTPRDAGDQLGTQHLAPRNPENSHLTKSNESPTSFVGVKYPYDIVINGIYMYIP